MAKVLVTGGAGFIGSHVTHQLLNAGHSVVILDDLSGGCRENIHPQTTFVNGSIGDKTLVDSLIADHQIEIIYHLAAYAAEGLSHFIRHYNYTNNLLGSINLINAAIKYDVKTFLFTSSMAVYGNGDPPFDEESPCKPEDPYGVSKYAVELDLKAAHDLFGMQYVIIRPHNVYGEGQNIGDPYRNVIGIFMNRIMQGKEITIFGDGTQTRAFSYIGDIAPCIARAPFIQAAHQQIINLGSGTMYTINELAQQVKKVMNPESTIIHLPPRYEVKNAYSTTKKSIQLLGFNDSTPLPVGLNKMALWAKQRGPSHTPSVWTSYELDKKVPPLWQELLIKNKKN